MFSFVIYRKDQFKSFQFLDKSFINSNMICEYLAMSIYGPWCTCITVQWIARFNNDIDWTDGCSPKYHN